ncbi:MAG: ABC transporter permease [Pseudomonadota bacterium]
MLAYYLRMGLKSLGRNPVLSALMIAAIALGIGVSMTTLTLYYTMSGNPILHKDDVLHAVQLDSWDPDEPFRDDVPDQAPWELTYNDAIAVMQSDIPTRHSPMYKGGFTVDPDNDEVAPFLVVARFTEADFFSMFDVPFLYGGPWDAIADENADRQVILSQETNEKTFGGENSVGRQIKLDDKYFTVVGVIQEWNPTPKFYDVNNGAFDDSEDLFVPFRVGPELEIYSWGNTNCWKDEAVNNFQDFLNTECVWIQYWAELQSDGEVEAFQTFLNGYVAEQKKLGRFGRPMNNRLTNVGDWLDVRRVVQDDNTVLVGLAFMFLVVCLLNTIGLLLAKFIGKANIVSLRRALGASRSSIITQHLVEVSLIGFVGGILGLGLAYLGLAGVRTLVDGIDRLVQMDLVMVLSAIGIAIVSSLLAGLYPTWRICQVTPATHLKTQ